MVTIKITLSFLSCLTIIHTGLAFGFFDWVPDNNQINNNNGFIDTNDFAINSPYSTPSTQMDVSSGMDFAESVSSFISLFNNFGVSNMLTGWADGAKTQATCEICNTLLSVFTRKEVTPEMILLTLKMACVMFNLSSRQICHQMIDSHEAVVRYIKNNSNLTYDEMCSILFADSCLHRENHRDLDYQTGFSPRIFWKIPLTSAPKPIFDHPDHGFWMWATKDVLPGFLSPNANLLSPENVMMKKFIHITDAHVDLDYTPGSNAVCAEPLCCTQTSGPARSPEDAAGYMGDYRYCDTRIGLLEAALQSVERDHPDTDFVLWTGDNTPHRGWSVTKQEVMEYLKVTSQVFQNFHDRTGIQVIPILGNHDVAPMNQFSADTNSDVSVKEIFDYAASLWEGMSQPKRTTNQHDVLSAWDSFRSTLGNYKMRIADKIVVITINSMFCMRLNLMNLVDPVDQGGALQWLESQLFEAERNQDKVFLVMHVPPDSMQCTQAWLYNFMRIIERYQDTIQIQIAGHIHFDTFRVYRSLEMDAVYNGKGTTGLMFASPSLSTFNGNNPAYRVFRFDGVSGEVVNYENFILNMTEANLNYHYDFRPGYDAKSFFRVDSLSSEEFLRIADNLASNEPFYNEYIKKVYVSGSKVGAAINLNPNLKKGILTLLKVDNPYEFDASNIFVNELYSQGLQNL